VIGLLVLGQIPTLQDLLGIALVIAGVALHQDRDMSPRAGRSIARRKP
jgi:drug/metabolite transporter (DMT)-like permease